MPLSALTGAALGGAIERVFDPVLGPLFLLPPWLSILVISFLVSLLVTVVYKLTTNQVLMRELKQEMKELNSEMKELRSHPEKMMEVQRRFMQTNMKYMSHSMKSTLYTIVPILLIFSWLNANLAFLPLHPDIPFDVTATVKAGTQGPVALAVLPAEGLEVLTGSQQDVVQKPRTGLFGGTDSIAKWSLKGTAEGVYTLEFVTVDGKTEQAEVLITSGRDYRQPLVRGSSGIIQSIAIGNEKLMPLTLFGIRLSWLWTYILFSVGFSMGLRRIMKLS